MGFVQSMVLSLKNNQRDRKSAFKKLKENPAEYKKSSKLYFQKKATPLQLKKIRKDIKRQNRRAFITKAIIGGIVFVLFIYFIGFVKF